ncbi:MAG: 50S ribosomal protein L28 [Candidatus Poribacteria bacterium]|nr:50S ribosomal protein L28 [Candidatus Poribacteria bacterium]MDE0317002.1 50S ribosomal protein L28 [Candidatus Poribacteria bacterium]MDE0484438.1 50S ribosomal protein L28 [Candidatus Poribacteria bacterium]
MARICTLCGKKPRSGNQISASFRHTKRRWLPNLQRVRTMTEEGPRRIRVCTSCIRSGKVTKVISRMSSEV